MLFFIDARNSESVFGSSCSSDSGLEDVVLMLMLFGSSLNFVLLTYVQLRLHQKHYHSNQPMGLIPLLEEVWTKLFLARYQSRENSRMLSYFHLLWVIFQSFSSCISVQQAICACRTFSAPCIDSHSPSFMLTLYSLSWKFSLGTINFFLLLSSLLFGED